MIIFQFPAAIIVDMVGRKKGMLLGNICNIIYLILFMFSQNLLNLVIAEIFSVMAFSLKDVADLTLINESIPETPTKSRIFAKLTGKGVSNYYALNSISLLISSFLFNINGYLPITISLAIVFISFLLSSLFIEPLTDNKLYNTNSSSKRFKNLLLEFKDSMKFILKSKRLRSLLIFSSIMSGYITIIAVYQVSILEELTIPSSVIICIFAFLDIIQCILSKKHEKFHNRFKNISLSILGFVSSVVCILIGACTYILSNNIFIAILITLLLTIKFTVIGIYQILIDKYYRNFTNEEIDTKIFSTKFFFNSLSSAVLGFIASWLLELTSVQNAFIILGVVFLISFLLVSIYMKKRLGLSPSQYSDADIFNKTAETFEKV